MYWQVSIAIVSVAAWLQMGQVVMDCLSIHRVEPRHGLANCRTTLLRHFSVLDVRIWS
jgi:hypothetical protein